MPRDTTHSAEFVEDEMGFVHPKCECGWVGPPCPGMEDAADAYGDHRAWRGHQDTP